jgi:hypothetical protein
LRIELGAGDPLVRDWNGGRKRGGARRSDELLREMGRSWGGESPNISSKEVEVLREVLVPVPKRKGGALLSGAGRVMPSWNDWALLLARLGRKKVGRFRLQTTG